MKPTNLEVEMDGTRVKIRVIKGESETWAVVPEHKAQAFREELTAVLYEISRGRSG